MKPDAICLRISQFKFLDRENRRLDASCDLKSVVASVSVVQERKVTPGIQNGRKFKIFQDFTTIRMAGRIIFKKATTNFQQIWKDKYYKEKGHQRLHLPTAPKGGGGCLKVLENLSSANCQDPHTYIKALTREQWLSLQFSLTFCEYWQSQTHTVLKKDSGKYASQISFLQTQGWI